MRTSLRQVRELRTKGLFHARASYLRRIWSGNAIKTKTTKTTTTTKSGTE